MKLTIFIILALLTISCGDGNSYTKNHNNIKLKERINFKHNPYIKIAIYSNISKSAIKIHKEKFSPNESQIKEFSNEVNCKDVNSNYVQVQNSNTYSYDAHIACFNYNMNNTKYKGSQTYLIMIGVVEIPVDNNNIMLPSVNADFEFLFTENKYTAY